MEQKAGLGDMNDWGKRCKGCAYCVHANKQKMKCFPESEDCKSEYDFISRDTKSFEWIDVKNESTGELVTQLIHIDRWMLIKCDKIL